MDCYNIVKDSWYSKLGPQHLETALLRVLQKAKFIHPEGSEVGKDLFSICICALKPSVYIGFYI